jgi:integrase/recombinase XerD
LILSSGAAKALGISAHLRFAASFMQLRIRLGLAQKVSPHWMRHAHASHALRSAPIRLVQVTLGHASVSTTGRYLPPGQQKVQASTCPIERADTEFIVVELTHA